MKLETLKEWLERLGLEANIASGYLHIWGADEYFGAVGFDGEFYPGQFFDELTDKDQGQITYLIAKWKGTVKHEAILEFGPEKG
jgi:hypothetical protein|nr:MAG TPA: hypothetical protein [Caudoviricetes sp.]